eukprot:TRINITY_DN4015_c0_g2_i3.p2 TRINITY_DN4015_c0_g2~~TRINITY_DN4015_c0_g2_i3.p2  ORF type:complete len:148 (-),score=17.65 TRINITY_DN4015_c0_g2_i3:162-605(-)
MSTTGAGGSWIQTLLAPAGPHTKEIAPAPKSTLDMELLMQDFPQLLEHVKFIEPHFLSENIRWSSGMKGPGPRNTKLAPLLWGLRKGNMAEVSPRVRSRSVFHSVFCIAKKASKKLRLIMACNKLNDSIRHLKLPACDLLSYVKIVE